MQRMVTAGCSTVAIAMALWVAIGGVAWAGPSKPADTPKVSLAALKLPVYGKQEIAINEDLPVTNPFDPSQGGVWVRFINPSGRACDIEGFYSLGYSAIPGEVPEDLEPLHGTGPWRVRFSPDEAGKWSYEAYVRDGQASRKIGSGTFQVEKGTSPGFVRVSKKNPFYFETDSGSTFFPIGENMGWYGSGRTSDYETWMRSMKNNGATYIRVWMCSWAFALEWSDTGLGDYSDRQAQAAQLDYVFYLAEKFGMKVLLCINNHGMFSARTNPEWSGNPFNAANGGPLKRPQDFFTNPQAFELFKQKLRYIVARWGYSTSLFAWELFNEVDITDGYNSKAVTAWHKEMAVYIKSIDPYHHPVTTSFGSPDMDPAVWSLPEIDFTQTHFYSMGDTAALVNLYVSDKLKKFGKPTIIGEFGLDTGGESNSQLDPEGHHMHIGLWSSAVSGSAGGAMLWWWDNYIAPLELYPHFGSIVRFTRGIDYSGRKIHPVQMTLSGGTKGFAALTPTMSWAGKPGNPNYRVTEAGVTGDAVASFLYGVTNNKNLRMPPSFETDLKSPSVMSIGVATIAKAGARLVVKVDGNVASDTNYPASASDFLANDVIQVAIPAGQHHIEVDDRGIDWMMVTGYRWESDAFPGIRGYSVAGDGLCLTYITDIRYTIKDILAGYSFKPIDDGEAVITGLTPGAYTLEFWDPWQGRPYPSENGRRDISVGDDGKAVVKLPSFTRDIAMKLTAR